MQFAQTSGGIFLDMSVHDIDLARWLLGSPKPLRVFATGTVAVHEGLQSRAATSTTASRCCEFEGGKMAVLQASRTMAHGHETPTEIIGTDGTADGRRRRASEPRRHRRRARRAHECTPTFYERFDEAFLRELNAFTDAVRNDAPLPLSLHDATEATRIGLAIQQSLKSKRSVDL